MDLPMALKMKNELLALLELKTVGAITEAEFLENKSVLAPSGFFRGGGVS